jgi:hypothetical protein
LIKALWGQQISGNLNIHSEEQVSISRDRSVGFNHLVVVDLDYSGDVSGHMIITDQCCYPNMGS